MIRCVCIGSGGSRGRRRCELAITALMVALLTGCETSSDSPSDSPTAESSQAVSEADWPTDDRRNEHFTGSARCAECHEAIAATYFGSHPMGHSVRYTDELSETLLESLPAAFEVGGRHYAVSMQDGRLTQVESMRQGDQQLYSQSCQVDFAVGSGTRGYSFVSLRDGGLFQAPVTWYSQKSKWDLSPGYDPVDHPRFERRMSDGCIFCHAGRADRSESAVNTFREAVFHESVIGCERCHGAGENHVRARSGADGISDDIVNPSKLDAARRDSVCFQCHLHGRDRILRTHRTDYDFRPGDRVSDVWVTFVDKPAVTENAADFKAVSQVEQMVASRCYTQSSGRLGCISCHDPHRTPAANERTAFYRKRCLTCHESDHNPCSLPEPQRLSVTSRDSCIHCHMPPAGANDVPHTAQTDHRVLRRYPDMSSKTDVVPPAEIDVFERQSQPVPVAAVSRAMGLKLAASVRNRSHAASAMNALAPFIDEESEDEAVLSAATWLLIYLGDLKSAQRLGERALQLRPGRESTREALTVIAQGQSDHSAALEHIDALLLQTPFNAAYHARRGEILTAMGRDAAAIVAWRDSLQVNPLLHVSREALIKALSKTDAAEAKKQSDVLKAIRTIQRSAAE